ncbi:MAG: 2-oxoacid:acceptor oxidoreductase family protein [Aeropyrum sp.]|nr:2-oxoacid:acceptor oxidoreductase family protein [Aeropyrum sp.]
MPKDTLNVVVVGVGGMGVVTLARVMAESYARKGGNALVAETHGLSQRGGSVVVHVRLGDVEAPLIPRGGGDVMLALEALEALRYAELMRRGGVAVVARRVQPPPLPRVETPGLAEVLKALSSSGLRVYDVDAYGQAAALGAASSANIYLLGYALGLGLLDGYLSVNDVEKVVSSMLGSRGRNVEVLKAGFRDGSILTQSSPAQP